MIVSLYILIAITVFFIRFLDPELHEVGYCVRHGLFWPVYAIRLFAVNLISACKGK